MLSKKKIFRKSNSRKNKKSKSVKKIQKPKFNKIIKLKKDQKSTVKDDLKGGMMHVFGRLPTTLSRVPSLVSRGLSSLSRGSLTNKVTPGRLPAYMVDSINKATLIQGLKQTLPQTRIQSTPFSEEFFSKELNHNETKILENIQSNLNQSVSAFQKLFKPAKLSTLMQLNETESSTVPVVEEPVAPEKKKVVNVKDVKVAEPETTETPSSAPAAEAPAAQVAAPEAEAQAAQVAALAAEEPTVLEYKMNFLGCLFEPLDRIIIHLISFFDSYHLVVIKVLGVIEYYECFFGENDEEIDISNQKMILTIKSNSRVEVRLSNNEETIYNFLPINRYETLMILYNQFYTPDLRDLKPSQVRGNINTVDPEETYQSLGQESSVESYSMFKIVTKNNIYDYFVLDRNNIEAFHYIFNTTYEEPFIFEVNFYSKSDVGELEKIINSDKETITENNIPKMILKQLNIEITEGKGKGDEEREVYEPFNGEEKGVEEGEEAAYVPLEVGGGKTSRSRRTNIRQYQLKTAKTSRKNRQAGKVSKR